MEDGFGEMDDIPEGSDHDVEGRSGPCASSVERAKSGSRPIVNVSPVLVEQFGHVMRERLMTGDVPLRKAYLHAVVDRRGRDREIRLIGQKRGAGEGRLANGSPVLGVRSFVRKWRTGQDSNRGRS